MSFISVYSGVETLSPVLKLSLLLVVSDIANRGLILALFCHSKCLREPRDTKNGNLHKSAVNYSIWLTYTAPEEAHHKKKVEQNQKICYTFFLLHCFFLLHFFLFDPPRMPSTYLMTGKNIRLPVQMIVFNVSVCPSICPSVCALCRVQQRATLPPLPV